MFMNKQEDHGFFSAVLAHTKNKSWYEPARRAFWQHPDRLMAARATFAIAILAIPLVLLGKSFFAVTLSLGVLAGALSETDDHPRGRIKSLGLKVISFGISSLSVELLRPFPAMLGIGLALSTVVFLLIGGIGERYRGVTFGSILVGIYAMIGSEISPAWYWQPILLPSGALFYGLISLSLLYYHPWRLLEEQLARGFLALAKYFDEKANLFPSDEKIQGEIRNRLALLNVELVNALEHCKEVLNSYGEVLRDQSPLRPYLQDFMLLQGLHERAASSHERYDLLSGDPANRSVMDGIGQLLHQLARANRGFAQSLLTGVPYHHPAALSWTVEALTAQFEKLGVSDTHPLALLIHNLSRSNASLQNLEGNRLHNLIPRLAKDTRPLTQRLRDQLNWDHPRLRYAVRLSLCFLAGFAIYEGFGIVKGEWIILTSLFVCQPSYSDTRKRLFQRIWGTISGVVGGVIIVHLLPTMEGQLLLMLLSAYLFFLWLHRRYARSVIFITVFVLCAFNLISNEGVAVMIPRLMDTLIGSALAIISVRFFWPDWQQRKLPGLLDQALIKNTRYFEAILNEYRQPDKQDDLDYRIARREAHQADNALALAWQDMQVEPKKQKQFREQAFTLTYLNHALLSYLSALGAHREDQAESHPEMPVLAEAIQQVLNQASQSSAEDSGNQILELLDRIRQRMNQSESGTRQQFVLLYNIAEVTRQLLDQAKTFNSA
jgi:uncharacterized membrane protein (TIGR01666 family)